MNTWDGLAWDDTIGWYDPEIEFCSEDGCKNRAVTDRPVGMYLDNIVTELVCTKHQTS